MKSTKLVPFAAWMVEHLGSGSTSDALVGDLMEELQQGRSMTWFWRQVCLAIAAGSPSRLRSFALPLVFCAAWTSIYPAWRLFSRPILARALQGGWIALPWPYSAFVPLGFGLVPAITFVWSGFATYVLLHPTALREVTAQRLRLGLSASLSVLFVFTNLLLHHFRHSRVDLNSLMREDFFSAFHLLSISIPLALSLLTALSTTVTQSPRVLRRRQLTGEEPIRRA
ncbi:MAG: hypothetical protein ABR928_21890, partial [Terracidiphilus sp.]